jgi:predicted SnoaL-like aldol condensation-catalyzing enzyme
LSEPDRTAREVAELYTFSVWNERNVDLADTLLADTMIRHDVGEAHSVTRAEVRKQIEDTWASVEKLHYDLRLVVAGDDGEHVAIVYDGTVVQNGQVIDVASIEVYRVVDGQISSCGTSAPSRGFGCDRFL